VQFKNPNTKNWRKLKEITRNNRCLICYYPLKKTGVFLWSRKKKDTTHVKCFNCLTVYNTSFGITDMGIPREVGHS
jgi:hypothetical protein